MEPTSTKTAANPRLVVRVRRVEGMPVMAARMLLRGGSRIERIPGQSLISGRLLAEGSQRRDYQTINRQAEDLGMLVQSFGTHESIGVAVDCLAADWRQALDWLAELALEPSFPADRFEWLRRQASAELDSMLDQPEARASRAFLRQLYGDHPYGRLLHGDAASLAELEAESCAEFHRQALRHGALVVVCGEIDETEVAEHLASLMAPLSGAAEPELPLPSPNSAPPERCEVQAGEADQAHLFAGHLSLRLADPDLPLLELAGVALGAGAGLSGRLPERIRERQGLAYQVGVAVAAGAGLDQGRLTVYVGTAPRNLAKVEQAVREELQRLLDDGLTQDEVEEARAFLVGREPFRRETARQWVARLAEAEFYGLPSDQPDALERRLSGVEPADVQAVLRRILRPQELHLTLGLPRSS